MAREIKFRMWNPVQGILLPCGNAYRCENGVFAEHETNNEDGEILMQFTGLKDKNGKEIYEGDIVGGDEVIFEDGMFAFKKGSNRDFFKDYADTMEIVGNIYENPELLAN